MISINPEKIKGKVAFITGATRGVGRSIAIELASHGVHVVVTGKTTTKHSKLPGTIFSVVEEIEKLGGEATPIHLDVRDIDQLESSIYKVGEKFGQIDFLINNASALFMDSLANTSLKKWELISQVNVRATTFACKFASPYLRKSKMPNIVIVSPPLSMQSKWLKNSLAYSISKFAMSMCTLGLSEELEGIRVNSLWPKYILDTSAVELNFPKSIYSRSLKPQIMADALLLLLTEFSSSGKFYLDEDILLDKKSFDIRKYLISPKQDPYIDIFVN